ncbi:PmoA family protein [Parafilimonas sp.]|uniref:DUF6807 domain-containing protein n=1 Tax=Parafilimonas sp. TaxID=1969739 RepID=UPI0039E4E124
MMHNKKHFILLITGFLAVTVSIAQNETVNIVKETGEKKINIFIGQKLFTSFLYPDTLEKPVLYPVYTGKGTMITRGFPFHPLPGEPTDHPHHIGLWFTYENVNGLDFWNNSYAIPAEKKHLYGWIKTDSIIEMSGGDKGVLAYHANWTNQANDVLLEETTRFEFSGNTHLRIIDRLTTLKANKDILFTDAKDGMLGLRVAHALQIPATTDQQFTDDKGNITIVKKSADSIANGNYITSEGKEGDSVWSTRAAWCKMYARIGNDSVSVSIIDHPSNVNYPTFWHARGYGLFAANPLGEKIFTNGRSEKNLRLQKGEIIRFYYRIVIQEDKATIPAYQIDKIANEFAKMSPGN